MYEGRFNGLHIMGALVEDLDFNLNYCNSIWQCADRYYCGWSLSVGAECRLTEGRDARYTGIAAFESYCPFIVNLNKPHVLGDVQ